MHQIRLEKPHRALGRVIGDGMVVEGSEESQSPMPIESSMTASLPIRSRKIAWIVWARDSNSASVAASVITMKVI